MKLKRFIIECHNGERFVAKFSNRVSARRWVDAFPHKYAVLLGAVDDFTLPDFQYLLQQGAKRVNA